MSKPLSTQTIWTLISALLLLAVGGFIAYTYLNGSKAATATVPPSAYNTSVVSEINSPSTASKINLFQYTAALHGVPQSSESNVQYTPADLGKTDLSRPE